jgi:hypothetical protein
MNKMNCELMLTYDTPALRQAGSRNLTGQKTLPTIWGTYMKLVIKYQISAINSCWEKCDEKWAYMFNVYKNQLSRQTGSRNLMGPKTLPTIWGTYMKLVTKYQISAINSCWEKCLVTKYQISAINSYREKCDEKYLGRTEGRKDGRTEVKQYTPSPFGERGYNYKLMMHQNKNELVLWTIVTNIHRHVTSFFKIKTLERHISIYLIA